MDDYEMDEVGSTALTDNLTMASLDYLMVHFTRIYQKNVKICSWSLINIERIFKKFTVFIKFKWRKNKFKQFFRTPYKNHIFFCLVIYH